jgi:hypothetical protein
MTIRWTWSEGNAGVGECSAPSGRPRGIVCLNWMEAELTEFQNFQNFSISIIPRFTIPIPLFSYSLNIGSSSSKVILKILKFCQNHSRWPDSVPVGVDFLLSLVVLMLECGPKFQRNAEWQRSQRKSRRVALIHPLPCSLRTQHLCVWFDIKTTRERSLPYPMQLNHRFHGGHGFFWDSEDFVLATDS